VTLQKERFIMAPSLPKQTQNIIVLITYVVFLQSSIEDIGLANGVHLMSSSGSDDGHVLTKRGERRVFLFITVFLFPALSIVLVGGYGLAIWLLQLLFGPPGAS
jgi:nitrate reductase NapE